MPVFPPDKVSNEEMEAITQFIDGLGGEHEHVESADGPDELVLHHWMALLSIEADDPEEGAHHLGHIAELTEGDHLAQMKKAIALLEDGDAHDGAHIVEEMLAGLEEVGEDDPETHLALALSSARVGEKDSAMHHLEHYLDSISDGQREAVEETLSLLDSGMMHDAVDRLEELSGQAHPEDEHQDESQDEPGHDDEPSHTGP
jgi:thioredoxin-like negative regulator of GroEL